MKNSFLTTCPFLRVHYNRMNELSKKIKLSVDELTYIVSNLFGFKDANDYTHYIDLYRYLIEKYDIKKISKNDQIQFFKDLRNKEIEYTGKLEELSKKPVKLDSLNRLYADGVRPECWKCVYDYQACLQPYVGVTNIVTSTPQYNTSIVSLSDGSYNILSSTTYTYTVNTVFYTVPGLSENQCTTIYKSCVAYCNNGL
ncbi:hypothetical protein SAMN05444410_103246 [Hydrobacter penzbergensis]|uniref:Uncharacterized protein n=2 Tax=Hydrobacter penzbergensis TaxID=1235997 RepID=A0A8X8IEY8_9BACT|nr:hypothetical protein SAMN05444410_103246 [Hydrobacter penzbergensis]